MITSYLHKLIARGGATLTHITCDCCYLGLLCAGGGEANQRSGYGGQQEHVCTL